MPSGSSDDWTSTNEPILAVCHIDRSQVSVLAKPLTERSKTDLERDVVVAQLDLELLLAYNVLLRPLAVVLLDDL